MNRHHGWVAIASLGALLAFHVSGCSATSGGRRNISEPTGSPARMQQLRASELVTVSPGARISLLLDDSTRVRGLYRGIVRTADDDYRAVYDAWRASHSRGPAFPELGESVQIRPGGKGAFEGFVAEGIELRGRGTFDVPFDNRGWLVRNDGSRLDMLEISELALAGELPFASAVRVQTEQGEERVPMDRVALVTAPGSGSGAAIGTLVGVAASVLIVAMIVRGSDHTGGCVGPYPFYPWIVDGGGQAVPAGASTLAIRAPDGRVSRVDVLHMTASPDSAGAVRGMP